MGEDKKVKKVGMKDIQRDGWEYELSVSLMIDRDTHKAIASKDRTNVFEGKDPFIITEETGQLIKQWCESGVDPEQDAYNHLLASDTLTQLTERWSFIGNKMQAVPRIFELKERLKVELSKQPA